MQYHNNKYKDKPLYVVADNTQNAQEDIGYKKPSMPWSHSVLSCSRKRSATESPLKQWWLAEKEKNK